MSRTLYLLRHGQTEYNRDRRLQGQCDSPLTELGIEQARAMGATLRRELGDTNSWQVWASPLGRAMQTARLVSDQLGLAPDAVRAEPRLVEVGLGDWETMHVPTLHAVQPELATRPDWLFSAPGGESYADVAARVMDFLDDAERPERLIVIAHGMLGRVLRGIYLGLEPAAMWQQDMPQDALFHLHGGQVGRIACVADEAASASA
ncbi:histidine phosphatase family protein [Chitinolyticbacter albus]|uniref:histidine phosphatase family protein n=1 Tax=Chitinolyticbacter albus TaxID=2961951 RepID=UPI00210A7361|nr:histidine phosphatase family protein [Chitinolyticbacter albus]